ncbi:MAG TPA: pentapeptide repeat-containing protein [Solirubrobacteraceae bacterium]|nr:pentapeptide repeat-containing protein [Solirubrobacteraceae bacterium]
MAHVRGELTKAAAIAAVLVAAAAVAYLWLPDVVVTPDDLRKTITPPPADAEPAAPAPPTAVDLVTARNGARTAAVAAIAALGAAVAAYFAARTYYLSRGGQLAERHARGAEQLANEAVAVRLSAIRRLERLVTESPADRQSIIDTIAAFLRHPPSPPAPTAGRAQADVQEALAAIDRLRRADVERLELNLAGADLRGVKLERAALRRADLSDALLEGASLEAAELEGSRLTNANAQSVWLAKANLAGADLTGTELQFATLEGADATGAHFDRATLQGTSLKDARLGQATGLMPAADGTIPGATGDPPAELP